MPALPSLGRAPAADVRLLADETVDPISWAQPSVGQGWLVSRHVSIPLSEGCRRGTPASGKLSPLQREAPLEALSAESFSAAGAGKCRQFAAFVGAARYRVAMTKTDFPTRERMEDRRSEILADLGISVEELVRRAEEGELVGDEWLAWAEIEELGYLLGE
ncbi:hypothetical protein GCM10009798_33470 [Nocardioides panacihumi]|uniref:Uncharacterized protein n=2 Tax=Nocardioides panacihumi TaxID=400774 RepID=A0ABN2RJJ6_9ACTN